MNITKENIDHLNAKIKIKIEPADYAEKVNAAIKKASKSIKMPGFRPGMVPNGMVNKMYGKAIRAEEVNRLAVEKLISFLDENKIEYLGQPLPSETENDIDWENQSEFEFIYDLGLAPMIDISGIEGKSFDLFVVEMDEQSLNENIEALRKRQGKNTEVESVEEGSLVVGTFAELDENGAEKEGGFKKSTYIMFDNITNDNTKNTLSGKKVNDKIILHPVDAYKDKLTASIYLGVKEVEMDALPAQTSFTITSISKTVPADLNQEFYDKIFGEGVVSTEEEFRSRLADIMSQDAQAESNVKLMNDIRKHLLETVVFDLPDNFLKRWMFVKNKDKAEQEKINEDYDNNKDVIRWELIRKKIADDNGIQVAQEEIMNQARMMVSRKLSEMGMPVNDENQLNGLALRVLENRDEYEKMANFIMETKALEFLKTKVKTNEKKITFKDFWQTLSEDK
jgi:trigger factor